MKQHFHKKTLNPLKSILINKLCRNCLLWVNIVQPDDDKDDVEDDVNDVEDNNDNCNKVSVNTY